MVRAVLGQTGASYPLSEGKAMAPTTSNRNPGRMAQVVHLLFPSYRWAMVALAVEVAALVAQLPPVAHVVVAVAAHIAIAAAARR